MPANHIVTVVIVVMVVSGCASTRYNHDSILFYGPNAERLKLVATEVDLSHTKSITSSPSCPSYAAVGGATVVCEKDINHTDLWLREVLVHEDCHHKQIHYGWPLNEQMCIDRASREVDKKMMIGVTGAVLILIGITR